MSLIKLCPARNNLIIPGQESLVSDIPAGDGKIATLFTVYVDWHGGPVRQLRWASIADYEARLKLPPRVQLHRANIYVVLEEMIRKLL